MDRDLAGRLVGRGLELGTFDRLLAGLGDGVGGDLVLVTGEPGIGKSSVLAEVGRRAEQAGVDALRGGCWEDEAPSYWPWRQVLRGLRDLGDLDDVGVGTRGRPCRASPGRWRRPGPTRRDRRRSLRCRQPRPLRSGPQVAAGGPAGRPPLGRRELAEAARVPAQGQRGRTAAAGGRIPGHRGDSIARGAHPRGDLHTARRARP